MTIAVPDSIDMVSRFEPAEDGLARKSQELVLGLLRNSAEPFSRSQFEPGHITCTALVAHPSLPLVLMMHHHRLQRWLLPGGHVEPGDASLSAAAARESEEETRVQLDENHAPVLTGIDVHGIPAKRGEPYHLHHDLIWLFRAASDVIEVTEEAPQVVWASVSDYGDMGIADSIRQSIRRAGILP